VSRFRLVVPGVIAAALCALAVFASAASAAGCEESGGKKCLFIVNGTRLAEGAKEEIKKETKIESNPIVKGKSAGAEVEVEATEVEIKVGFLLGGIPGKGDAESVAFKNVTVKKPKGCEVPNKEIRTEPAIAELVETVKEGKPTGEVGALFLPKKGTTFWSLTIQNKGSEKCSINGVTLTPEGELLAKVIFKESNKVAMLLFEKGENDYRKKGSSTTNEAKLKTAGELVTVTGRVGGSLVSGFPVEID
jgi:hypothetical protein